MRGSLIYVASPYSHPDKVQEEINFLRVVRATGWLMNTYLDKSFYSPICHTHPIATRCQLPGTWDFWKQFDEAMLSCFNELWVLCIPGWNSSKGVAAEVEIATSMGLPIKYIILDGDEYFVVDTIYKIRDHAQN